MSFSWRRLLLKTDNVQFPHIWDIYIPMKWLEHLFQNAIHALVTYLTFNVIPTPNLSPQFTYFVKKEMQKKSYIIILIMAKVRNGVGELLIEYINLLRYSYMNSFLNILIQILKRQGLVVMAWLLSCYCAHLDWNGVAMSKSPFLK